MALIITPENRAIDPYPGATDGLKLSVLRPDEPYVHMTEVPPGHRYYSLRSSSKSAYGH
jgi:hypothetical protein